MGVILKAENVDFFYGRFHALKNVTLEVEPNSICSLIGPSGCGKSTFLRLFNRMNDFIDVAKIERGKVFVEGKNIYEKGVDVIELRKKIGMVFQKPTPFPKSIFENVVYGLKINGIRNKKTLMDLAEDALKKAYLWNEVKDVLNRSALSLSGGQQQRLCIARTLAVQPKVILMDEPTSALDPIATDKIEELIYDLKQQYTIVIVTHNLQQSARVSDYTAFFYMGELIEYNATKILMTNPREKQTEDYITVRFD